MKPVNLTVSFAEPEYSGPLHLNILPNSPRLAINPNNYLGVDIDIWRVPQGSSGNIEARFPLRLLQAKAPNWIPTWTLQPSSCCFPPSIPMFEATHAQKVHWFNAPPPFPVAVWLSGAKLSLPTDIQQSFVEKVISEEIALGLYTSAMAACLSSGKDLPSIIGSHCIFFLPRTALPAPNKIGIRWGPTQQKVRRLWKTF